VIDWIIARFLSRLPIAARWSAAPTARSMTLPRERPAKLFALMDVSSPFPTALILGAAVGALVLFLLQRVLAVRQYLTVASRQVHFEHARSEDISAEEKLVLESADTELAREGFQLLFVGQCSTLLTYFTRPEFYRVFLCDSQPVLAVVARRAVPELGAVVSLELETALADGTALVTRSWYSQDAMTFPGRREESLPGAGVGQLKQRHLERLREVGMGVDPGAGDVSSILHQSNLRAGALRADLRARGYVVPTSDPELDRFTLRGAFAVSRASIKQAARPQLRQVPGARRAFAGIDGHTQNVNLRTAADINLRIAADINAASRIARHPIKPPGPNPALLAMMLITSAAFFSGALVLWGYVFATIILAVVAFHEAGHALAMRLVGYRDVNVFFVPFVGALTVGSDTGASVRQRILVMLAGPVPGLWLAAFGIALLRQGDSWQFLEPVTVTLLIINTLNLLPLTPLDGGRALELLTPPESVLRIGIQAASGAGLLAIGIYTTDSILIALGALWLFLIRRQMTYLRLRREVARKLDAFRQTDAPHHVAPDVRAELQRHPNSPGLAGPPDPADPALVLQLICTAMAAPAYASWGGVTRIDAARALVQQFTEVRPTGADRLHATLLYAFAWVPVVLALLMWQR
jgi:Zn-dependent protease